MSVHISLSRTRIRITRAIAAMAIAGVLNLLTPEEALAAPKEDKTSERAATKPASSQKSGEKSESAGANDAEAVELLRAMEQRHGSMQAVTGRFLQTKLIKDSPEEIKYVADFAFKKPNHFRADYLKPGEAPDKSAVYPYRNSTLIVGRDAYQYIRDAGEGYDGTVNVYRFQDERNVRDINYLLLGFGHHTEELLKVYRVKNLKKVPNGYRGVQLIPLNRGDAGFESISMLVTDNESLLPAQFSMLDAAGSRTTVDLEVSSLQINAKIRDSVFRDNFPSGAPRVPIDGRN